MPALPAPRARVEYKKPSRLNAVSFLMLVFVAAAGYVAYTLLPAFRLRSNAKNEMADFLPAFWRGNLRADSVRNAEMARIKKELTDKLRKVGVLDPKLEVRLERTSKVVSIEARFTVKVKPPGLEKTYVIPCAPKVETEAGRVEW